MHILIDLYSLTKGKKYIDKAKPFEEDKFDQTSSGFVEPA